MSSNLIRFCILTILLTGNMLFASPSSRISASGNSCETALLQVLKNGADLLDKDRDSLDLIIRQVGELKDNPDCPALAAKVANSYYARLLWMKYSYNRYQINQRTALSDIVPSDMNQWSRNLFYDQILSALRASLQDPVALQEARISEIKPFISPDTAVATTPYLLLSKQALALLTQMNQNTAAIRVADSVYKQLFSPAESFVDLPISEQLSPVVRFILSVYQQRLRFDMASGEMQQLVFDDLARLEFVQSMVPFGFGQTEYYAALEHLMQACADKPASILVAGQLLSLDFKKDLTVIDRLLKQYPRVTGSCDLLNLKYQLESGSADLSVASEQVANQPISCSVIHKNVREVNLTLINESGIELQRRTCLFGDTLNFDYEKDSCAFSGLQYGRYSVIAETVPFPTVPLPGMQAPEIPVKSSYSDTINFVVTDMMILTSLLPDYRYQVLVVDRTTGKPVKGATVSCLAKDTYRQPVWDTISVVRTDKSGLATLPSPVKKSFLSFNVVNGADRYLQSPQIYGGYWRSPSAAVKEQTLFFTDRSLYRPGQTVYYKCIAMRIDSLKKEALANKTLEVTLYNAQNEVLSVQKQTTDSFGAVSGEFLLPRQVLNGNFHLATSNGISFFQVADYKRPSFEVMLNKPVEAYAYGDTVMFSGSVKSFTGVSLGYSQISYQVDYQSFLWQEQNSAVASGTLQADGDGDFRISFPAKEVKTDLQGRFGNQRFFAGGYYHVTVTATSPSGETQQNTIILPIGQSSVSVRFSLTQKQPARFDCLAGDNIQLINRKEPEKIRFSVTNLSEEPVKAKGIFRIYQYRSLQDTLRTLVRTRDFDSEQELLVSVADLKSGKYLFQAEVKDAKGRKAFFDQDVILYEPNARKLPVSTSQWTLLPKDTCKTGDDFILYYGSAEKDVSVLYQLFSNNTLLETGRFELSDVIKKIQIPYSGTYWDEVGQVLIFVKKGSVYVTELTIHQQVADDRLFLRKETFRDKLLPGQKESWTFSVTDINGKPVKAQVLADMFDASLNMIYPHRWDFVFPRIRPEFSFNWNFWQPQDRLNFSWEARNNCPEPQYPTLNSFDFLRSDAERYYGLATRSRVVADDVVFDEAVSAPAPVSGATAKNAGPEKLSPVDVRTDLNETAFFYPDLVTDSSGNIQIRFTAPEALTRWNLMLLATTPDMRYGQLNADIVTTRELMIKPNLPRFVRQGDSLCIRSAIFNQSKSFQSGKAVFELFDPANDRIMLRREAVFEVKAGENTTVAFCLDVPAGADLLGIRVTAATSLLSDGEQQIVPVLPSRALITESMPIYMPGSGTHTFRFGSYLDNRSATSDNFRYTVEFTGNPAWYAVQALPALSELINRSANAAINSFYVNTLASYIAQSDPGIRKAIGVWEKQGGDRKTLISGLQKNEALKQILLKETPWIMQATTETENMQALSQLFNTNRQEQICGQALDLLARLQNSDGGFAWYENMPSSLYQTLHILDAFARLVSLNAFEAPQRVKEMQIKAINYADQQASDRDLLWAYVRSSYRDIPFYGKSLDVHKMILKYYRAHTENLSLYDTALLSLTLRRYGFTAESDAINARLRKIATHTETQGMFWANNRNAYGPTGELSTHVLLMTALMEGGASEKEMNEMKLWLLSRKQTQMWESAPATVDAIYGILMTGSSWLTDKTLPVIKVDQALLHPNPFFAYADTVYDAQKMTPQLGLIEISQKEDHPGYGAAYWQYYEDFDKVRRSNTGLSIEKKLFRQIQSAGEILLEPLNGPLTPGDRVVARMVLIADRDYEFVTLTDQRAACFEPVEQLSGYRYHQGVGYYLETNDAATNWFFSVLPKGTYVFEYALNTALTGVFQDGISSVQCLYAPQFTGNTQGSRIEVR
ncbi:MAG: alpha-2-macroglobulin family protein [Bacteroidales bacterium]